MFHIFPHTVPGISTTDSVQKRKHHVKIGYNSYTLLFHVHFGGGHNPLPFSTFAAATPTPDLHLESAVPAARRKVRNLGGSAFKLGFRVTVVIWKLVWDSKSAKVWF